MRGSMGQSQRGHTFVVLPPPRLTLMPPPPLLDLLLLLPCLLLVLLLLLMRLGSGWLRRHCTVPLPAGVLRGVSTQVGKQLTDLQGQRAWGINKKRPPSRDGITNHHRMQA